jgi:hypothetical protein
MNEGDVHNTAVLNLKERDKLGLRPSRDNDTV